MSSLNNSRKKSLFVYLGIVVVAALLLLPFLGSVHLFDSDEVNYAESAREMILTGDYMNVQIDFEPFPEKPPLFFWLQVVSMKLFGINEFAARFPNFICGIITLIMLYFIGSRTLRPPVRDLLDPGIRLCHPALLLLQIGNHRSVVQPVYFHGHQLVHFLPGSGTYTIEALECFIVRPLFRSGSTDQGTDGYPDLPGLFPFLHGHEPFQAENHGGTCDTFHRDPGCGGRFLVHLPDSQRERPGTERFHPVPGEDFV